MPVVREQYNSACLSGMASLGMIVTDFYYNGSVEILWIAISAGGWPLEDLRSTAHQRFARTRKSSIFRSWQMKHLPAQRIFDSLCSQARFARIPRTLESLWLYHAHFVRTLHQDRTGDGNSPFMLIDFAFRTLSQFWGATGGSSIRSKTFAVRGMRLQGA